MEQMDSIDDGASIVATEDRLSNLPDDVIHHILSFIDMRYAIQTSTLSRRWEKIWTSMPQLNLNSYTFGNMSLFNKFVEKALSHRNNHADVSGLELTFTGAITQFVVEDIVYYAYLNNVRQMTMKWSYGTPHELPQFLFSSHTLKHLTLDQDFFSRFKGRISKSVWDLPALETLNLSNIRLGDVNDKSLSLFSKCVNLKDLTLDNCSMHGLEILNICAPQLTNLTITETAVFPMIFNVVAHKIENLTASVNTRGGSPPCFSFLRLSGEGFDSLEKVHLLSNGRCKKERLVPCLLDLFRILHHAKFLILDVDIIESLASCLGQLSHEPCPFDNLNCLKINTEPLNKEDRIPTLPIQVRNYLLENSPNAIFIMELSQVIAKLKKKIQMQFQVIGELNANIQMQNQGIRKLKETLGAGILQHEKLIIQIIKCKVAELKVQVDRGSPNYKVIRSLGCDIQDLIRGNLRINVEAQFYSQYEELKSRLSTRINSCQWTNIENELGIRGYSELFGFDKFRSQSAIRGAEVSPAPRPSYANVPESISRQHVSNDTVAKKVDKLAEETKQPETIARETQNEKMQMQDQVFANQKAKLEKQDQFIAKQNTEIQKQDQLIQKLKARLERQNLRQDKLILQVIKCKIAELKVHIERGNPDYQVVRSIGCDIKDLIPKSLKVDVKALFSSQYEEVKSLLITRIDATQWAKIDSELWNSRCSESMPSNSSQSQSVVRAVELPPAPRLFSDNMPQKRSREQVPNDTLANKAAKLESVKIQPDIMFQEKRMMEAKIRMQDQVIGNLKAMLGARDLQHEKLMSHIIKCKMAELKVQVECGNPDYEVIRSIACDMKDLIPGSINVNVEAMFSSQYEEVKSLLLTRIDVSHWEKIEIGLGNLVYSGRLRSNNSLSRSVLRAAEVPPATRPSFANTATSSRVVWARSNSESSCE